MRRETFFKLMLVAGLCLTTFSCSDEDKFPNIPRPPLGSDNDNDTVPENCDSIVSSKKHQTFQQHRSSDNFSIDDLDFADDRNAYIRWTLDSKHKDVEFKVMIDKSGEDGEVFFGKYLKDGSITTNDREVWKNKDNLYIADPRGAESDFTVTYHLCVPPPRHVWVSCADAEDSKSKRSSHNIYFLAARNKIVCSNPKATFYLRHDKGAQSDAYYISKDVLRDGDIIPAYADAFVCGASDDFLLKLEPADDPNYTDWMGKLPDSIPLHQLSIPGTHDSGTGNDEIAAGLYKCQNFDFPVQMSDGIRYFDVRLNKDLITHHGGNKSDTSAEMLFGYAKDFLEQHPTETLFFLVTPDNSVSFMMFFEEGKHKEYNDITWREENMPATLGEPRGKIILLRRFGQVTNFDCGIDMHTDWPDDAADDFSTAANDKFYVQDRFFSSDEVTHDTEKKKTLLRDGMEKANGESFDKTDFNNTFFIQYSSIAGRVGHTPWDYAWGAPDIKSPMNDFLDSLFEEYEAKEKGDDKIAGKKIRTGVIVMDFYNRNGEKYEEDAEEEDNHDLVRRIINFNLPEGQKIP